MTAAPQLPADPHPRNPHLPAWLALGGARYAGSWAGAGNPPVIDTLPVGTSPAWFKGPSALVGSLGEAHAAKMLNALDEPVRSIAAFLVITAEQSDTLRIVAEKMVQASCSALLVACDHDQHAIITEHDVLVAIAAGADPDDQRAMDIMSRDVQEVKPDTSIADTADLMRLAGIRHVLVRGETGRMGVVSIRDLLDPLLDC